MSLTEIGKPVREAGFVGADQEFRFEHSEFETPLRQTQEYAEMAVRNTPGKFLRYDYRCCHHMDGI